MNKLFFTLLIGAMGVGASASVAFVPDENDYDENIRKEGMSVRKHYTTQQEAEAQGGDEVKVMKLDRNNTKYKPKPKMTKAEYEALAAEKKAEIEAKRKARQAEIDSMLNIDYTKSTVKYERKPYVWSNDEVTTPLSQLMPNFNVTNVNGKDRYLYDGITLDLKENDVFFYFNVVDGKPDKLRFRCEFYADDPLNFSRLDFLIDKFKYSYTPENINRGKDGSRFFYENFDEEVNDQSKDIAYALSHCKWAVMTFISENGVNHRIYFKKPHLQRFKEIYELYRLMGGEL